MNDDGLRTAGRSNRNRTSAIVTAVDWIGR